MLDTNSKLSEFVIIITIVAKFCDHCTWMVAQKSQTKVTFA